MDRIVYDRMAAHDSTHWWYRARRDILADYLARYGGLPKEARILGIGCGTGHNLPMLARFSERWPDLPIVIDHAAKPHVAAARLDPWRDEIAALAARGAHCKLSGLRTEQAPGQPADLLMPYVDHLVGAFGDRLMWGSDWPVLRMSGDGWRRWLDDATEFARRSGADLARLFSGCAADFYDLEP